jgi:predicted PurR-regulated permease PerM
MKSMTKHLSHYMALFGILLAGFAGLILFSYDKNFQVAVALALTLSYVAWGVIHHYLHRDLHIETFIEYLVVAVLGFVIIFSLLLRT